MAQATTGEAYRRSGSPFLRKEGSASTVSGASSVSIESLHESMKFLTDNPSSKLSSDLVFHASIVASDSRTDDETYRVAHKVLKTLDRSVNSCRWSANSCPNLSHVSNALDVARSLDHLNGSKESKKAIHGATNILATAARKMIENGDVSSVEYRAVIEGLKELEDVDPLFPQDMSHVIQKQLYTKRDPDYAQLDLKLLDSLYFEDIKGSYEEDVSSLRELANFKWSDTINLKKTYLKFVRSEVYTMMRQQIAKGLVDKAKLLDPSTAKLESKALIKKFKARTFTRPYLGSFFQYLRATKSLAKEIKARA
ncbi:MAG: hypothetical protein P0S95_03995 [Rhabdochlamydiaceae bacterium]|nr:hypothetical protein [Candidatus Amphrikana amoebophyrae]